MGAIFGKKVWIVLLCLISLLVIYVGLNLILPESHGISKAEVVREIRSLYEKNQLILQNSGTIAKEGYRYYLPSETAALYQNYQEMQVHLNYLVTGKWQLKSEWQGYQLLPSNNTLPIKMVTEILSELNQADFPKSFWNNLKVFLLPEVIPEVSGLGGAGFVLLGAVAEGQTLTREQIEVTLLHELGHHLHALYLEGKVFGWQRYLTIRGSKWHQAGQVNTQAWSDSTEETFAEDFRMIFGKNQPYYDDLTLGDPRAKPKLARALKEMMLEEVKAQVTRKTASPWLPDGFWILFWLNQPYFLLVGWLSLALLLWKRAEESELMILKRFSLQVGTSKSTLT